MEQEGRTEVVNSVYRMRLDDGISQPSEWILFDKTTTGVTGIGNEISFYESFSDLCMWLEPTVTKHVVFNPDTQKTELKSKPDDVQNKIHYEYPFEPKNIEMIKKLTRNNRKRNFYVWDKNTNKAGDI